MFSLSETDSGALAISLLSKDSTSGVYPLPLKVKVSFLVPRKIPIVSAHFLCALWNGDRVMCNALSRQVSVKSTCCNCVLQYVLRAESNWSNCMVAHNPAVWPQHHQLNFGYQQNKQAWLCLFSLRGQPCYTRRSRMRMQVHLERDESNVVCKPWDKRGVRVSRWKEMLCCRYAVCTTIEGLCLSMLPFNVDLHRHNIIIRAPISSTYSSCQSWQRTLIWSSTVQSHGCTSAKNNIINSELCDEWIYDTM